jgi:hypothetical protein
MVRMLRGDSGAVHSMAPPNQYTQLLLAATPVAFPSPLTSTIRNQPLQENQVFKVGTTAQTCLYSMVRLISPLVLSETL